MRHDYSGANKKRPVGRLVRRLATPDQRGWPTGVL